MYKIRNSCWTLGLLVLASCGWPGSQRVLALEEFCSMFEKKITMADDIYRFFPKNVQEVHEYGVCTMERAQKALDVLIALEADQRNFDNTARALDTIQSEFSTICSTLQVLEMVSPDAGVRNACHEESIKLQAFAVDAFSNKKIYNAFKAYIDNSAGKESLNAEQLYFNQEVMRDFIRAGLELADEQFEPVQALKKEIAELELVFDTNIADDKTKIVVTVQDLDGCDQHFIDNLQKNDEGKYLLGCDYPTYFEIKDHCKVQETRKRLYFAYQNRAYPQNLDLLNKIIAKRDELAKRLGFASYAALDIDSEMVKTPERAKHFIDDLVEKARVKANQEFQDFKKELPQEVMLDANGLFNPWDLDYVKNHYKKKHFDIDERVVAEYFPAQQALKGVFDIYQQFLNLEFTMLKPSWAWHEDVQLLEVRDRDSKELCGYIFLDLYPRDNKYSHACLCPIVPTIQQRQHDGTIKKSPSLGLVIANFPKATADRPALLKHGDVETFFHEFGHAMHSVLGSTELASFSGTSVKRDFVEMPSQIFEEWLFDKPLLQGLTHHYQTGKPLPDALIDKMIALKKFDSGMFLERQCIFSLMALEYFGPGATKDTDAIRAALAQRIIPEIRLEPDAHFQASFGHLTGYGAKYYGYMWSKVFALDLFYVVKEQGLLNPEAGKLFVDKILSKGGSIDPNILLKDYLGREPNDKAFFQDLGIAI